MNELKIVMYHYVRDAWKTEFPNMKTLSIEGFQKQIEYFQSLGKILSTEELYEIYYSGKKIEQNSFLLTFDDGYIDHYETVLPILKKKNLTGFFFPPVLTSQQSDLLDVNKIHLLLGCVGENKIYESLINKLQKNYSPWESESYRESIFSQVGPSRFDNEKVLFIKRMLQLFLPEDLRKKFCEELFFEFKGVDINTYSSKLYMNEDQIRELIQSGMQVGSHGLSHCWLGKSSREKQTEEILKSKDFLMELGMNPNHLSICYPYGSYNDDTLEICRKNGFKIGFTTKVGAATETSKTLELERFDTNDFYRG